MGLFFWWKFCSQFMPTSVALQIPTELTDLPKYHWGWGENYWMKNVQLIIKEMVWFCKSFPKLFINNPWCVKVQPLEAAVQLAIALLRASQEPSLKRSRTSTVCSRIPGKRYSQENSPFKPKGLWIYFESIFLHWPNSVCQRREQVDKFGFFTSIISVYKEKQEEICS